MTMPTMLLPVLLLHMMMSPSSGFHVVRQNDTGFWEETETFSLGKDSAKGDVRIIGGQELKKNSWPYLVMIGVRRPDKTDAAEAQWCGGAVLGPNHVLTAAHCMDNRNLATQGLFIMVAGEHTHKVPERTEQFALIDKIIKHPAYNRDKMVNDIAVVKLASSLTMGPAVGTLPLNNDGRCPQKGNECMVAGWGRTPQNPDSMNPIPLVVNVPVWDASGCSAYDTFGPDQICAGRPGQDICKGDSGSPLICQCGGGMKLAGVVSYTSSTAKCGSGRYPGGYARVSHFLSWIQGAMRE